MGAFFWREYTISKKILKVGKLVLREIGYVYTQQIFTTQIFSISAGVAWKREMRLMFRRLLFNNHLTHKIVFFFDIDIGFNRSFYNVLDVTYCLDIHMIEIGRELSILEIRFRFVWRTGRDQFLHHKR